MQTQTQTYGCRLTLKYAVDSSYLNPLGRSCQMDVMAHCHSECNASFSGNTPHRAFVSDSDTELEISSEWKLSLSLSPPNYDFLLLCSPDSQPIMYFFKNPFQQTHLSSRLKPLPLKCIKPQKRLPRLQRREVNQNKPLHADADPELY